MQTNSDMLSGMEKGTGALALFSKTVKAVGAWAFRRWTPIRWLVTGLAGLTLVPVATRWIESYGDQNHWFDNPNAQVDAAMTWLSALASDPWFLWISGTVVGIAIGLWLDGIVRRFAPAKSPQTEQPISSQLSSADQAINGRLAWSAVLELQREINLQVNLAERSYSATERELTKRFSNVRPRLEALSAKASQLGLPMPNFVQYDWFEVNLLRSYLNEIEPFLEQQLYKRTVEKGRALTSQINERIATKRAEEAS